MAITASPMFLEALGGIFTRSLKKQVARCDVNLPAAPQSKYNRFCPQQVHCCSPKESKDCQLLQVQGEIENQARSFVQLEDFSLTFSLCLLWPGYFGSLRNIKLINLF